MRGRLELRLSAHTSMALRLTDRELSTLTAAMTVMLTPFCYQDGEEWRNAVCSALPSALHSTGATFALAAPNEPFVAGPRELVSALQALLPPPAWLLESLERRRKLRLNVAGFGDIHDVEAVKRTEFYNDVVIPHRLFQPLVLAADFPALPLPAVLGYVFEDDRTGVKHVDKNKQMLSLLVPAFIAGITTHLQLSRYRATIAQALDSVAAAATIVDVEGKVIGENKAMKALIDADPERSRLREAVRHAAFGIANVIARGRAPDWEKQSQEAMIRTAFARYRVSVTLLPDGAMHKRTNVLALTERMPLRPLNVEQLALQFGLTVRESETAQLMARGYSNREVATAMGISLNTARRHAEHVLLKLDVHSRAAVVARLSAQT